MKSKEHAGEETMIVGDCAKASSSNELE